MVSNLYKHLFAIVTDEGIVGNIVVLDDPQWLKDHDDYSDHNHIDITDLNPQPGIAWTYDFDKKEFKSPEYPAAPKQAAEEVQIAPTPPVLKNTQDPEPPAVPGGNK
jgi:hypothetical protein